MVEVKSATWELQHQAFLRDLNQAAIGEGKWPLEIVSTSHRILSYPTGSPHRSALPSAGAAAAREDVQPRRIVAEHTSS